MPVMSAAHTLAIKEALRVEGSGHEAEHGAWQGEEFDVAPSLPARCHCAGAWHQECRHCLRLLTEDVEDLQVIA